MHVSHHLNQHTLNIRALTAKKKKLDLYLIDKSIKFMNNGFPFKNNYNIYVYISEPPTEGFCRPRCPDASKGRFYCSSWKFSRQGVGDGACPTGGRLTSHTHSVAESCRTQTTSNNVGTVTAVCLFSCERKRHHRSTAASLNTVFFLPKQIYKVIC